MRLWFHMRKTCNACCTACGVKFAEKGHDFFCGWMVLLIYCGLRVDARGERALLLLRATVATWRIFGKGVRALLAILTVRGVYCKFQLYIQYDTTVPTMQLSWISIDRTFCSDIILLHATSKHCVP